MAWQVLQSKSASGAASTQAATFSSGLTAGSKIIAIVQTSNPATAGTNTISSVNDGSSNNFTIIETLTINNAAANSHGQLAIAVLDTPSGDVGVAETITAHISGTSNGNSIWIGEVTGLLPGTTTAIIDGTPGTGTAQPVVTGSFTVTFGSTTTTLSNEFLLLAYADNGDGSGTTTTTPAGYTADPNNLHSSSASDVSAYYKNSTGGTESPTTLTCSNVGTSECDAGVMILAFKLAPANTPAVQVNPGTTWKRAFKHRHQTIPVVPTPPGPPPPNGTVAFMHRMGGSNSPPPAIPSTIVPIKFVQNVYNNNFVTAQNTFPATLGTVITTAGNTLICNVEIAGAAGLLTSVTDSKGNAWSIDFREDATTAGFSGYICSSLLRVPLVTGDVVTFNLSGNLTSARASINEFSGVAIAPNAGDQFAGAASASALALTQASSAPLQSGDLAVSCMVHGGATQGATTVTATDADTGLTWNTMTNVDGWMGSAYEIIGSSSNVSATWTTTGTAPTVILVGSYKAAVPAPPQSIVYGGTGITWRVPRQISRVFTLHIYGFAGINGQTQPRPATVMRGRAYKQIERASVGGSGFNAGGILGPQPVVVASGVPAPAQLHPIPRRYPARANIGPFGSVMQFIYGVTGPNAPPRQTIAQAVPPRRKSARAAVGNYGSCWLGAGGIAGPGGIYGQVQPKATLGVQPRRKTYRAVVSHVYGFAGINGQTQPWPTVAVPRRNNRQRFWIRNDPQPWDAIYGFAGINGQVQPRATLTWPRRYPTRALVKYTTVFEAGAGIEIPNGQTQPRATIQPRRTKARAVISHVYGPSIPNGQIQPRATVPIPRRTVARAVLPHFIYGPSIPNGQVQPRASVPIPRRYPSRLGKWASVAGPQPGPNGRIQPRATVPVPRRYPSRAGKWAIGYGPQPAAIIATQSGTVQPEATFPQQRRKTYRAVVRSVYGVQPGPYGTVQPRATVPIPRRKAARAVIAHVYGGPNAGPGVVQAWPTIPVPRRKTYRAVVRSVYGPVGGIGVVQPSATRQPRRKTYRAVIAHVYGFAGINGQTQSRASVPIPRRKTARAVVAHVYGGLPAFGVTQPTATRQPRRSTYRAVVHSVYGPQPAIPPNGTVQPRATVPIPRRRRGVDRWSVIGGHGGSIQGPIIGTVKGTVQPWATIPVPRRTKARAWLPKYVYAPGVFHPNGTVQSWATVPIPRRKSTRAVLPKFVYGLVGPVPYQQPRATVPIPRRTRSRAVLPHFVHGPLGYGGTIQPRATVPIPRRTRARAVIHNGPGTVVGAGRVQPRATVPVPRRKTYRAVIAHVYGVTPGPYGRVQSRATLTWPRRYPSRGRFTIINGITQKTGKPGGKVYRRTAARAVFNHIAGMLASFGRPMPKAAVPVPRRTASRAVWESHTGSRPLQGTTPPSGVRLVSRRGPARLVFQHTQGHYPVNGTVQPRATVPVPRRRPARAVVTHVYGPKPLINGRTQPTATRLPRRTVTRAVFRIGHGPANDSKAWAAPQTHAKLVYRRTGTRVHWANTTGNFTLSSGVEIQFNIYTEYTAAVTLAFNVGQAVADREALNAGLPWLSTYDASRRMAEDMQAPLYDGKIRMSEDPKGYLQGGSE